MSDIELKEIISDFEKTIDCTLDFSEDNTAELIFNKDMVIGIRYIEEDSTIILSNVIANDLPDPISKELLKEIFKINSVPLFTYGGNNPVIARDPSTEFIFVYEILTKSILQAESLFSIFSEFVRYAMVLREHITNNSASANESLNNYTIKI